MKELLAQTINAAKAMKAVDARELSRVIVDSTVQEKAIAHPTDSRLLEVARTLMQDTDVQPHVAITDWDSEDARWRVCRSCTAARRRRWIKRRQGVEPVIGHLKQAHRLDRCWLKGVQGDALNAIGAAAGYNLRWLMRWIVFLRAWLRAIMLASMVARSTLHATGI